MLCGSGAVSCSSSLLIRRHQRARCQAEIPLTAPSEIVEPPLSFNLLFLVASVAPLALIGVVIALLLSNSPMGFVAILGIVALVGILIRNSVILVVQIETLRKE